MTANMTTNDVKNDPRLNSDPQLKEYIDLVASPFRYRGLLMEGFLANVPLMQAIEHFVVRPDDIWQISYPKSGSTWLKFILSVIHRDGEVPNEPIPKIAPQLEADVPPQLGSGHIERLKNMASPRVLATHLPVTLLPEQLLATKAKVGCNYWKLL